MFDFLKDFKVVDSSVSNRTISHVRVSTTSIIFSSTTAADLGYPERVKLLIHPAGEVLAVQATEETDKYTTIPFCTADEMEKLRERPARGIRIANKDLVYIIREKMEWKTKNMMKAFGTRYARENVIIFNLLDAMPAKTAKKKSVTADEILSAYPDNITNELIPVFCLPAPSNTNMPKAPYTSHLNNAIEVDFQEVH